MCEYIKDNGEQCSINNHDGAFCHMHEDTEQAERWRDQKRADYGSVSGSQSDASGIVMDETCGDCEAPLRRIERLSQHPNQPRRLVFEAVVECDCDEHVLGATSERIHSLPEGWT